MPGPTEGNDRDVLLQALGDAKRKIARLRDALAQAERRAGRRTPARIGEEVRHRFAASRHGAALQAKARAAQALSATVETGALWPGLARERAPASGLPLRIAVVGEGAHALEDLRDPRAMAAPLQELAEPDLVLFPRMDRSGELERRAATLPEAVWRRLARGEAGLVLDASGEGIRHEAAFSEGLHALLGRHGVAPDRVAYLTQDRGYGEAYGRWRAASGASPVQVWIFDHHARKLLLGFEPDGPQLFDAALARHLALGPTRPRRFLALAFNPRPTKMVLLLRLLRDGLWDQGLISFAGFDWLAARGVDRGALEAELEGLAGFQDLVRGCGPWLEQLERMGPQLLGDAGVTEPKSVDRFGAVDLPEYARTWFSIVPETEMAGRLHRVTEKSFKPLVNFHPMLVLGGLGALKLVRAYGFETFGAVFDEAYDDEPDPRRRFDMVYAQVKQLCAAPEAELARRMARLEEVLAFNARWGLLELPRLIRHRLETDLVDRLVALRGG